jgi:2-polyprenyl-3-methyl-5-hydroxy-6-metoxy-1,4-benzoquinol methylase
MNDYLKGLEPYWTNRFRNENKIWGDNPSKSAYHAIELFQTFKINKILVPGSGYGRHTKLFSSSGYDVTGIEISSEACSIAKKNDPNTKILNSSVLDIGFKNETFDAIYCFNVLHLFREKERKKFIYKCYQELKINGICFFVVFSEEEESYGKGKEIEKNTFESKPGRPVHYFSKHDLQQHFKKFEVIEEGIIDDPEEHGDIGRHTHRLRYMICEKTA